MKASPFSTSISLIAFILLFAPWQYLSAQTYALYGITSRGGDSTKGALIGFDPTTGSEHVVYTFGSLCHTQAIGSGLVYDPADGLYYGTSENGGNHGVGTIFSFDPTTGTQHVVWSFGGTGDGSSPVGSLAYDPGNALLYGMTYTGGAYLNGVIYSFDPATGRDTVRWSLGHGADGSSPEGAMTYDPASGLFYAAMLIGGTLNSGAIISFDPVTDRDSVVWSFLGDTLDGASPDGSMVYDAARGLFYGMTSYGGRKGFGTIYSFDPLSSRDSVLWTFDITSGGSNGGILTYYPPLHTYYAMTYGSAGAIISFDPATAIDSQVWTFGVDSDGVYPSGGLVYNPGDGRLYGMMYAGGSQDSGAIISYDPATRTERLAYSFKGGNDGAQPLGPLTLVTVLTGINEISTRQQINIYPNPNKGEITISGLTAGQNILVLNTLGQSINKYQAIGESSLIDLSGQDNGIYIIQVINQNGSISSCQKVLKMD